ncbi:hypothetical protein ABEB36_009123 [Hypothenemus hampei]|uniref:Glycogen debranching enzyme n=1 Tax=Hypothenemus hampei TaxID=57062 RepID=A0ABD1ET72_HYPHA
MLYLLVKLFLFLFIAIIWYYGIVLLSCIERFFQWGVNCILCVHNNLKRFTGSRQEESRPEAEQSQASSSSGINTRVQSKKSKSKKYEEPKFSTKLSTPIEAIIEETLNEDISKPQSQSSSPTSDKETGKIKKKKKSLKKPPLSNSDEEQDSQDFVFVKKPNKKYSEKNKKPRSEESESKLLLEKRKSGESLNDVIAQGINKKKDTVKTTIIDHFKVPKRDAEKSIFRIKPETKEAKKVCSTISYASVVTNTSTLDEASISSVEVEGISQGIEVVAEFSENLNDAFEIAQIAEDLDIKVSENLTESISREVNQTVEQCIHSNISSEQSNVPGQCSEIFETNRKLINEVENTVVEIKEYSNVNQISQQQIETPKTIEVNNISVNNPNTVEDTHITNLVPASQEFSTFLEEAKGFIKDLATSCVTKDIEIFEEKTVNLDDFESEKIVAPTGDLQKLISAPIEESGTVIQTNNRPELTSITMTQIRVLTLNDKEHGESTIYRIDKGFVLQFRLGPTLLGRKIKLYCNYPEELDDNLNGFNRSTYQLLNWCQDEGCKNSDDTASFAQLVTKIAGSFHYYFIFENENIEERQGSGYFIVDPVLRYGKNEILPIDSIQCQTVLAKHLGPFSTWENKLRVSKESGYNVIHFTPVQELGASNSSYSLSEQLKLNPCFNEENGTKPSFKDLENLTNKLRRDWKVLSICDIVLNHTANESEWLKEHPEATYNCFNCPYLRPAYLLDATFYQFSMDVKNGLYEDKGIPSIVSTEDHLNAIRYHFKLSVLEPLKIHELFTVDINKYLQEFLTLARKASPSKNNDKELLPEIEIIQDPEYKRLCSSIDINLALKKFNSYRPDSFDEESRVKRCAEDFKIKLESLNNAVIKEITDDLNAAVENVIAGIRYFRVQADGPKFKEITINHPLVHRYFTDYEKPKSLDEHEKVMYNENSRFLMAHNGWVMNLDPLKNFAENGTKVYFRRELIAWGDSVKLRFGNKPEDSPFLWEHMRKYVEQTAKIFDGVRLDNCHSTPIVVAEYLLDCARKIRPDLYVVAELFTNSDLTDNIYVNRLGITSLIREAMSAWDSHEQGRLVYRYGGVPVGSFFQPNVRPLVPMVAHALFLDLTHDNPSPIEKRSVFDLLPSAALVNMACCASGSNRGYDELVPHHIHVVDETRKYTEWSDDESLPAGNVQYVNNKCGIIAAKRALNDLHFKLGIEGYNQVFVDQIDTDIVAVTRHNPVTHTSFVLVAFTAFSHPDLNSDKHQRVIRPLRVEGVLDEIVLEASLNHIGLESGASRYSKFQNFVKDSNLINGLSEYRVLIKENIQINESDVFEEANSGAPNVCQLNFKNFKPGSIVVVKVSLPRDMAESVLKIRELVVSLSIKKTTELSHIMGKMSLSDLNRALYRCDQEERDEGHGFDTYNIPNFGPMVYCGLQGFMSLLANIRPNNDLGHPFCANLRDGNWMIDYVWKRLKVDEGTNELGKWFEENTKPLRNIPRYLIPSYFDMIITGLYINLLDQSYSLMSDFVKNGSTFVKGLSLGSLQFGGYVKSANLPVLSPNLAPPKPPTKKNDNGETVQVCVTLSAGLPHFSVGYMRNWGRDTFIAMRGLFILTGRFEEARQHILAYAACLRHGLIPNLLDGGRNPRFNCRDAIWWWLFSIKSYCDEYPSGTAILSDLVSRIFPTDDSPAQQPGIVDQPLHDVIQEALKVHFQGMKFRERNAGRQIDEHMTDAGFNNQIGIHPETGFVFGGNQWNCGTWMDKMGSSDKAGNRGKPATPRDGSAVELVGLSKSAISWLAKLNKEGKYPYDGVERLHKNGMITKWTFQEWGEKIQHNFEKCFWIGSKPSPEEARPDLINKKNIYKDSFGASQPWTDYQLRCNFPIAMVAAPELFNPQHAWAALTQAENYLLGLLGMKTLDPEDWNYRGDYDNSNDSTDFHIAHGFNYHQGPEWVWPVGFFLRAKLIFASENGKLKETLSTTKLILSKHFTELQTSPWRGLPELTNSNGSYCRDSSRTQAWSMSCILEILNDLQRLEAKQTQTLAN